MAGSERVTVTRAELVRVLREGQAAAGRATSSPLDCPYSAAGDADERLRVAAWMRAYTRARNASS